MKKSSQKRILIVSHGHPDINKGGAEVAAYNLHQELLNQGEDSHFLARTDLVPHGGAAFSTRNNDPREILFHTTMDDNFLFSNIKTRHLWQEFRDLLLLLKPDVIHLHHYFLLGIEIFQEIRQTLPNAKILLTLHEFLAICHHNGLMIKTNDKLCYKASSRDCSRCFPKKSPGDFFLREQYIKKMFQQVDVFISPSQFLKDRYCDWGLDEKRVTVIENGQPEPLSQCLPQNIPDTVAGDERKVRFAYFGQINPYKGIDILLKAIDSLPRKIKREVTLDIHGANLDGQKSDFKDIVEDLLEDVNKQVNFYGSYEAHEMPKLLSTVDWAIVPSIWWENSPMVIQEAHNYQIPLIVSDIGGMAEKVEDNVDGLHFRAGKSASLAEVITRVVTDRSIKDKLKANIKTPLKISKCASIHLELY